MKSVILAAGYATRLYPLTKDFPKPLLPVGALSILDRLIGDLDNVDYVDEHIIVSNASFFYYFEHWKTRSQYKKPIRLINDGTTSNETRLGAVRDILLVIEQLTTPDDLLILAGDNVVDFSFSGLVDYAIEKACSCISCYQERSISALQKTGVLETDEQFRVIALHEKPQKPPSNWAVPPFYYYRKEDLKLISTAIEAGCGFDAPGNLAAWLCSRTKMFAWPLPGKRYDIGDLESYEKIKQLFN